MMSKGGMCEVPRYQKMEICFGSAQILECGDLLVDLGGMSVGLISCIDIALLMSVREEFAELRGNVLRI